MINIMYGVVVIIWLACAITCGALRAYHLMVKPKYVVKNFFDPTRNLDEIMGKDKKLFLFTFILTIILALPAMYSALMILEYFADK